MVPRLAQSDAGTFPTAVLQVGMRGRSSRGIFESARVHRSAAERGKVVTCDVESFEIIYPSAATWSAGCPPLEASLAAANRIEP